MMKSKSELECGPMPNVMAAQANIAGALCESSLIPFLVPRRKVCLRVRKFLENGFQAWPHIKLVYKFRDGPLRDSWDPLSTNLGPKLADQ